MQSWHEHVVAGRGGVVGALLRPAFWMVSVGYAGAVRFRNRRYDGQHSGVEQVGAPVISVGNITTGGTGKTPMVIAVAERLVAMGRRPAVVSRGYKAIAGEKADEVRLIERAVPEAVCVANPDRVAGARWAVGERRADVIVLDDGFQHRRLARDLDIVLVDATRPFGGGYLLPRGTLREPVSSLARADLVVVTRSDQVSTASLRGLLTRIERLSGGASTVCAVHSPGLPASLAGEAIAMEDARRGSVFLLSGIGHHDAFARTVESIGLEIAGHARFEDHHAYRVDELESVGCRAKAAGAIAILTTGKDAVKLADLQVSGALDVWVLPVRIDFPDGGRTILEAALREVVERNENA